MINRKFLMGGIFGITAVVLMMSRVSFADTTIIVSGNTSISENSPGWMFNRDVSTSTPYVFNLSAASIGSGSLYVLPIGATAADKFIGELFLNKQIADLNSIKYDFKIGSGGEEADKVHFYMNVYANFGASDDFKFYDCRYSVVPTTGSTGSFTTVTFDPTIAYPVATRGGVNASPYTCPAIPADMNGLSAGSNIRAIALNVGDTSINDQGLDGYYDNVKVDLDSNGVTTYDFDPEIISTPIPSPTVTPNPFAVPAECTGTYGAPIVGTNGSNNIKGTGGNDLIFALGGSDKVDGKGGNDCIVGGGGSDSIDGGSGDDVVLGGDSADTLKGGGENDKLYGGNGADSLDGGSGDDYLNGEAGTDKAVGGTDTDTCMAESQKTCEL